MKPLFSLLALQFFLLLIFGISDLFLVGDNSMELMQKECKKSLSSTVYPEILSLSYTGKSRFEARAGLFRLLMKGIFDAYEL